MKIVVQRVSNAKVETNNKIFSQINQGLVLLACIEKDDTFEIIQKAAKKIGHLRIFNDPQGKMNLNIQDIKGDFLCISQFTLSWRGERGNRPSFDQSMPPKEAEVMFNKLCQLLQEYAHVQTGRFGEHMNVSLINDGPVTFHLSF